MRVSSGSPYLELPGLPGSGCLFIRLGTFSATISSNTISALPLPWEPYRANTGLSDAAPRAPRTCFTFFHAFPFASPGEFRPLVFKLSDPFCRLARSAAGTPRCVLGSVTAPFGSAARTWHLCVPSLCGRSHCVNCSLSYFSEHLYK